MNTDTILIAMVAVTGISVLLQLIVLLAIFVYFRKAMNVAKERADEFNTSMMPILNGSKDLIVTTRELISRLEPKLNAAATDLSEMVREAHVETTKIQATVDEINEQLRRQAARVDGMTTSVLNGVDRLGNFVNEAVSVPVRQVSGIVAAARAVVETLRAPAPPRRTARPTGTTEDKDLFV